MTERRIALIGYGAIASDVAAALRARCNPAYRLAVLLSPGSPSRARVPEDCRVISGLAELEDFGPALVIEAAGHEAVRTIVPGCLELGLSVLVSSVGALQDDALFAALVAQAQAKGGRILLPSGALGGLDYVRAARSATDFVLQYESRKPPAAWRDELARRGIDAAELTEALTLYHGSARGAAAAYPANLNVAAALAVAGLGMDRTEVTVVVDPSVTGNTHIVSGTSELGSFRAEITNRPSPANPKTSWIVARSLLAAVDQQFSPVAML